MPKAKTNTSTIFKYPIDRYPRLDTVLMIEEALYTYKSELTIRQIWEKLPKQVMWQTFLTVLDYLEYSNKIRVENDKTISWIWDPKGVEEIKKKGLIVR
jgi:hypothetical protein